MNKRQLSWQDVYVAVNQMWAQWLPGTIYSDGKPLRVYGVPRGGIPIATLSMGFLTERGVAAELVDDPKRANVIVDDLLDSGDTKRRYTEKHPYAAFLTAFTKVGPNKGKWLVFPWERMAGETTGAEDVFTRLLQYVGEDPKREGLLETPARAAKAWAEWCSGYSAKPEDVLKVFEDGATGYDQMVVVRDIPVYSHCEHHLAAIFGKATVAYIPDGKVLGLSKMNRLVEIFSRRLQVQERLTVEIADALNEGLKPLGVGVVLKCRHMCMESRGIKHHGTDTVTSALRGAFRDGTTRAEFMQLVQK
jgi:GTP cyclohydrolase IA